MRPPDLRFGLEAAEGGIRPIRLEWPGRAVARLLPTTITRPVIGSAIIVSPLIWEARDVTVGDDHAAAALVVGLAAIQAAASLVSFVIAIDAPSAQIFTRAGVQIDPAERLGPVLIGLWGASPFTVAPLSQRCGLTETRATAALWRGLKT